MLLAGSLWAAAQPVGAQEAVAAKRFVVQDVVVNEGEVARVAVLLSSPAPAGGLDFTVDYNFTTTPGQATADINDFVGNPPETLTIAAGRTFGTLSLRVKDDATPEAEERLRVTLSTSETGWHPRWSGVSNSAHIIIPPNDVSYDPDSLPATLWSATLTVQTGINGCDNGTPGSECRSALSDDGFTLFGATRPISSVVLRDDDGVFTNVISILPSSRSVAAVLSHYDLHVDGEVRKSFYIHQDHGSARWAVSGVSWSAGDSVELSLRLPSVAPSGVVLGGDGLAVEVFGPGKFDMLLAEGVSTSFTVALAADPGGTASVSLLKTAYAQPGVGADGHVWDTGAVTVAPASLTFTSGNYSTPQTVTVTAVDDDDGSHEQLILLVLLSVSGGESEYEPVGGTSNSVTGVYVTVADDDAVAPAGLEGSLHPQGVEPSGNSCGTCGSGAEPGVATRSPYAELIERMYEWRNDPQWVSYKSHTDRWDRALKAFGEHLSDTSLSAMTAAEAQALADTAWGQRWVDVAAALREIESGDGGDGDDEPEDADPSPHAGLIERMYGWRNDPQWSSYKSHTDRWDRALKALGEHVADTALSAMTAAEAQALADTAWGTRWVDVAAALHNIENP